MNDPKGEGQPSPYNTSDPPQDMRPNNMGHQMHGGMGQSMPTQHVPVMQPTGMFPSAVAFPMMVGMGNQMGLKPAPWNCPSCQQAIVTRVEPKATMRTHMCAFMMLMMCCLPCVLIPYCTNTCRNMDHYCPNCNTYIGSHVNTC